MILLDYSAVAIANIMRSLKMDGEQLTEFFALHMILNSIRKSNKKFSREFGTMVICCDAKRNWRRSEFEYYKYKRRKDRKEDDIDWDLVYKCLDFTKDALVADFPYLVIEEENAEADDIIGELSRYATEHEKPTVVVSNDKDFVQGHSKFVCQWRPCEEAFIRNPNPKMFLKELVIRGDRDDGIPNIKSANNHFTIEGKRQKSIYQKELDIWINKDYIDENDAIPTEFIKNYYRNQRLIDLHFTPNDIKKNVVEKFEAGRQRANKGKMVKFFMKHRLRYLHEKMNDFM